MEDYLVTYLNGRGWDADAISEILKFNDEFMSHEECRNLMTELTDMYRRDVNMDYSGAHTKISRMSKSYGLNSYSALLLFYLYLTEELPEHYQEAGLPQKICVDSMDDLKWKAAECHRVYGVWGIFVAYWYPRFFNMTRFTLGRLQFESITSPGPLTLNIHIPSSGPLYHDACLASYRQASEFYEKYFGVRPSDCFCHSWLLYPEHEKFLPENSNILPFMRDYEIIENSVSKGEQDLWRIFYRTDITDYSSLPEETSLQRSYKKWLLEGNPVGMARGRLHRELY